MGYRYPNGAFSVILNVPHNPYASTANFGSYQMAAKAFKLENALEEAKKMLQQQIKEQTSIYADLKTYFKNDLNANLDLDILLKQNQKRENPIQEMDFENYQRELNSLMFEYKSKYIGFFSKRNQTNYNTIDQEILNLINVTYQKIKQLNGQQASEVDKKIQKINNANKGVTGAYYNVKLGLDGSVTINNQTAKIDVKALTNLQNKFSYLMQKEKKTFAQLNAIKNLKGARKKNSILQNIFDDIYGETGLVKKIIDIFQSMDTPIIIPKNLASEIVTELLKSGITDTKEMASLEFSRNPYSDEHISAISGDLFEFSAQAELEKDIQDILGEVDYNKLFLGGVVTEKTRVILQIRSERKKRSKKAENNFKQRTKLISEENKKLHNFFDESIKLAEVKDKIDNYLLVKDTQDLSKVKFTLAFSDKLKYSPDGISLIGGQHTESSSSTLLNSLDLIGKLSIPQSSFIFSVLNSSPASAFAGYGREKNIAQTLEDLLTSLVFDLAYNPNNFTAYLSRIYGNLDLSNNRTLYLHRSGPKIIPSFQILQATLDSLTTIEEYKHLFQPVKVAINYGNKSGSQFWNNEKASEYSKMDSEQKQAEWNYVATQVANSIYISVIMNLSPILFDIEKAKSII